MGTAVIEGAVVRGVGVGSAAAVRRGAVVGRGTTGPGALRRAAAALGVLVASTSAVVALGVLADVAVATHAPPATPAATAPR